MREQGRNSKPPVTDLESSLSRAIEAEAPDILDDLMQELGIEDAPVVMLRNKLEPEPNQHFQKRKPSGRRWMKAALGVAAALVLTVSGLAVTGARQTVAVVGLDVNPGIEMEIDRHERVKQVNAINEEAHTILADMDLTGSDINVACNAIIGSLLTHGYLNDQTNSILVSVRSDDPARGRQIEQELAGNVNAFLEQSQIGAAILGKYVEDDSELSAFASANGISLGKAWLIRALSSTGRPGLTEPALLKLSTQDLILLGQEYDVRPDASYGSAETSRFIGKDQALQKALADAGIKKSDATGIEAEYSCEDGMIVYEVEFHSGGKEYEYDIDASTGAILSSEKSGSGAASAASGDADDDDDAYDDDDGDDDDDDDHDHDAYDDDRDDDDHDAYDDSDDDQDDAYDDHDDHDQDDADDDHDDDRDDSDDEHDDDD